VRYSETIASQCRYGDVAARIFGEAEIIWEHSEKDYQGFAKLLARMPDGRFAHYEWEYGSCGGCDDWENRELSDDSIESEMRGHVAWLPDVETARRYLHLDGDLALSDKEVDDDLAAMRTAFGKWCCENKIEGCQEKQWS